MIAIKDYFRFCLFGLGIVLMAALTACGAGGKDATQSAGYTLTSSAPTASAIYISSSAAALKQSDVFFTLTKSGVPQSNQTVTVSIDVQSVLTGVTFLGGGTSRSLSTDTAGNTSIVSVLSGTLPTSVTLTASWSTDTSVKVNSASIKVISGNPTQERFTIAASKYAIEGWDYANEPTTITVTLADRQGNFVPDGTIVNFTSGLNLIVQPTCTTTASRCSITASSSVTSPLQGYQLVTILAYTDGEEQFVDNNANNKYDSNEAFTDLGKPFRDNNRDGMYQINEDSYPSSGAGTSACTNIIGPLFKSPWSVPNTCNGVWDANAQIRQEITIRLAASFFQVNQLSSPGPSIFNYEVKDLIAPTSLLVGGMGPPAAATIAATIVVPTGVTTTCVITDGASRTVLDSTNTAPYTNSVTFGGACAGQGLQLKIVVTTPKSNSSTYSFAL